MDGVLSVSGVAAVSLSAMANELPIARRSVVSRSWLTSGTAKVGRSITSGTCLARRRFLHFTVALLSLGR